MKLVDMETSNGIFTWNNKIGGPTQVALKLDRFIVSKELLLRGSNITTLILPFGGLYHWPIQLEVSLFGKPRNTPFRFENAWLTHSDFLTSIEKWWKEEPHFQGTKMFLLHCRLKLIKMDSKSGIKMNLEISSKLKEKWKRN